MPRISVIVAAHNAAATISAALVSVKVQTFGDWEVVVGDDCSTDETAAIAAGVDPRVRVVTSRRNQGHAAPTRNMAAAEAQGELLAFLDGDDEWEPDYLEVMIQAYDDASAAGRRVGAVSCDALLIGDRDAERRRTYFDAVGRPPAPLDVAALLRGNPLYASALVPKEVFDEVGAMDTSVRGADDYDLWLRIAEAGYDLVVVDRPLARYRLRDDQISADERAMARATAGVYRRVLARRRLRPAERRLAVRRLLVTGAVGHLPGLWRAVRNSRGRLLAD